MTMRYRITNRLRFVTFIIVMIITAVTICNFALGLNTADSLTVKEYVQVEIVSGDTLWNIADEMMTNNTDIRESVYELCQLNNINAGDLQAGMTILVPIYN